MRKRSVLFIAALAALPLAAACGDDGPRRPVSVPHAPATPADLGEGLTAWETPAESLLVYGPEEIDGRVELVFHRGRGIARDGEGRAYVPDPMGSRVLVVDEGVEVTGVLGGPDTDDGGLGQPLSAAPIPEGGVFVTDAQTAPGLFYYDADGGFAGAAAPPVGNAEIRVGPGGDVWAARSPYVLRFDPTEAGEPLLYRFDPLGGEGVGIAAIEPVADPGWNRVANAGSLAVGADGTGFFAFFLRNELRAYSPAGDLLWRTRRGLPWPEVETGPDAMRPVTQALALAPDGLLYALTVPDTLPDLETETPPTGRRRLEAYDPESGAFVRAAAVPAGWTSFAVDPHGVVYRVDADSVEATAPPPERRPLPRVELTTFEGDSASFDDWAGKALLVNFWASWCVPCQRELPQLAAYYGTLDHDRVEFLAISTDETRGAALEFIEEFDLPFPVFYAGMGIQSHFGFYGLPYTIVVDPQGRIVEEIYGFGNPETWEYLKGRLEEEMERVTVAAEPEESGVAEEDGHAHD